MKTRKLKKTATYSRVELKGLIFISALCSLVYAWAEPKVDPIVRLAITFVSLYGWYKVMKDK